MNTPRRAPDLDAAIRDLDDETLKLFPALFMRQAAAAVQPPDHREPNFTRAAFWHQLAAVVADEADRRRRVLDEMARDLDDGGKGELVIPPSDDAG